MGLDGSAVSDLNIEREVGAGTKQLLLSIGGSPQSSIHNDESSQRATYDED